MTARKIVAVAGARPNLMKLAPILRALGRHPAVEASRLAALWVHTGQHYDRELFGDICADLRLPPPEHQLGVGGGSHAATTGEIMRRLEPVLVAERPDVVVVVGDVNSTVAAAFTAAKLGLPVAHVEAGLRCFDRSLPEEINRVVTDALADLLFTSEAAADANLRREGKPAESIHFVGNVMVDSLLWALPLADASTVLDRLGLERGQEFAILTVHRQGNVESAAPLTTILSAAAELSDELPVIFPAHPRTRARIGEWGLGAHVRSRADAGRRGLLLTEPLGYLDFIHLLARARVVLTDSGGVQDETTALGVPCVTLRDNTERPVTIDAGTNVLAGREREGILAHARAALRRGRSAERTPPPLWDGHTAERIIRVLADSLGV